MTVVGRIGGPARWTCDLAATWIGAFDGRRGSAQFELLIVAIGADRDDIFPASRGIRLQRVEERTAIRAELFVGRDTRAALITLARGHIPPSSLLCHGMFLWAIRTHEPWTIASILTSTIVFAALVAALIFVVQRRNR
jgi:hypothetical protein